MKTPNLSITLTSALILLFSLSYGQSSLSANIGLSSPLSELSDEDIGGATIGISLGAKYTYNLMEEDKGLALYSSLSVNRNILQKDIKNSLDNLAKHGDVNYWEYYNIPLTVGLNYKFNTNTKLSLITHLGFAANFLKITEFELNAAGAQMSDGSGGVITAPGYTGSIAYDWSSSFGLDLYGGVKINKNFEFGLEYLYLGRSDLDGKVETTSNSFKEQFLIDNGLKVNLLRVTCSYHIL